MRPFVIKTLGLVTALLLATALALYALLHASLAQTEGNATLAGLSAPVRVERDALGIPSLRAATRPDAARALGYVHAQERYFQMDLMRRSSAGELAELVGPAALPLDREKRLHRLRHHAAENLTLLPAADRALLDAYTDGVNAGLAALGVRPFEYLLLNQPPEPWTAEDSLLVGYALFLDLTDEDGAFERGRALMQLRLPAPLAEFVAPRGTPWDAPLAGPAYPTPPIPGPEVYDLRRQPPPQAGRERALAALSAGDAGVPGSNAWAVDATHSRAGAMVAGDMHLNLGLPQTWFRARMRVEQPALDLVGVTLPGLPILIAGSNTHIAWAFTNSYVDTTDVVALGLDPADPSRYRTPEGWQPFTVQREVLEAKGASPETQELRETIWGPVVPAAGGGLYAVHWLGAVPGALNMGLVSLETASSAAAALNLSSRIGMPPQNLVVADSAGHVGWTIAGFLPRRVHLDGALPASWAAGAGWDGWLSSGERPQALDPPSGRIWTANARIASLDQTPDPTLLGDAEYDLGARQGQIRDALLAKETLGLDDMLAIHLDDRALFLERWQELLLHSLGRAEGGLNARQTEALTAVQNWQARASIGSVGYRIVRSWRSQVRKQVFASLLAPCFQADPSFRFEEYKQSEGALWSLVSTQPAHLLDPAYPSWNRFLLAMLERALDGMAGDHEPLAAHPWGEVNTLAMRHPLSRAIPQLSALLDMPAERLPGDNFMPRVQSASFGASQRAAVSPGREAEGYFHMPGGQSGHPLSPYYRAGHAAWVQGKPTPYLPGPTQKVLELRPAA